MLRRLPGFGFRERCRFDTDGSGEHVEGVEENRDTDEFDVALGVEAALRDDVFVPASGESSWIRDGAVDDVDGLGVEVSWSVVVAVDGEGRQCCLAIGAKAAGARRSRFFGDGSSLCSCPPCAWCRHVFDDLVV